MALLGTPTAIEGTLNEQDLIAMERIADVLRAGFPLVAVLQLIRVYAQSIRKIAEAEVRLFHLYVHEPLIRQGVDALQMAEEMEGLARDLLPLTSPLMEYIHQRYLRFYIEQDVVGHMEAELGGQRQLGRVQMAFCFVDLTGFTRYTEEEGDEEAFDLVERFVETVEATLPAEATIVKTIGDEVMIVSPDPVTLTEWAVGFLTLFQERPQPRVGVHYGRAVYRDGDYFGTEVNLAHRVVARALGGEVMVTTAVVDGIGSSDYLEFDPIGEVDLKGFPQPVELFVAKPVGTDAAPNRRTDDYEDPRPRVVRSPAWGLRAQTMRLAPWPRSCVVAASSTRSPPGSCWSRAAPIPPAPRPDWPVRSGRRTCMRCMSTTAFVQSADRDERVCRDLCSRLRIDLHIERPEQLHGNLQAAARETRYAAAEQLRARAGGDWIATGHTRTDLAETVLYRLAVSPGTRALRGLPAHSGRVVRPLLELERAETRRLAAEARLPFADDETNLDLDFARNRVRAEVLPVLHELSHGGRAEHRRDAGRAGRGGASAGAGRAEALEAAGAGAGAVAIRADALEGSEPALRRLALRALAERAAGRAVPLGRRRAERDHAPGGTSRGRRGRARGTACGRSASTG